LVAAYPGGVYYREGGVQEDGRRVDAGQAGVDLPGGAAAEAGPVVAGALVQGALPGGVQEDEAPEDAAAQVVRGVPVVPERRPK